LATVAFAGGTAYADVPGRDPTCGVNGMAGMDVGTIINAGIYGGRAAALQADGKLVLAGVALGAQQRYAPVRFNSGGTLDTAFASGGTASAVLGLYGGSPNAIAVQPDSRILVAGNCFAETGGEFCALRLRGRWLV